MMLKDVEVIREFLKNLFYDSSNWFSFFSFSFFPPFVGKAGNNSIARHVTGSLQKVTEFFVCSRNISRLCGQLKKKKIIWETTAISGDRYVNIVVLRHAKVWIWYSKENWMKIGIVPFFLFFFLFSSQVNRFLEDLIIMQIKWRSAIEQKSIETILYGDYIRKFQSGSRILLVRVFFSARTNSSFGHVIRSFLFQLISTLIYDNYLSL